MELMGIMLSVPVAFVCGIGYAWLLNKLVWPREGLRRAMRAASIVVLGLIAVEIAVVASVGPVRARAACGPLFYAVHVVLFFAAIPALANLLMLKRTRPPWRHALVVGCACAVFAIPVVVMEYVVSEELYGPNGNDGPFSAPPAMR